MKELLLSILSGDIKPFKKQFLMKKLNLKGADGEKILNDLIKELENKREVRVKGPLVFYIFKNKKQGKLSLNKKGFGFISTDVEDEDDFFVHKSKLNGAMNKDVVEFATRTRDDKVEAIILKVVERNSNKLVGNITRNKNGLSFKCDDLSFLSDVNLIDEGKGMDGEKVILEIVRYSSRFVEAKVVEVLGHKDDPGIDILGIIHSNGIPIDFDPKTIAQSDAIELDVNEKELASRTDLTDKIVFTIDGAESKDLDDAIHVEKLDNGNYLLGVHIADVSHYVTEGSPLDDDAFKRGTSVYLLDRVIPMLPRKLSNGICSLNPFEKRLTMSCDMEIDAKGYVVNKKVYSSYIESKYRMTYKQVNQMIHGDQEVRDEFPELTPKIDLAIELSHILRKRKFERGTIDFEVAEAKFILDEDGMISDVIKRSRDEAEMLIEDFMVAANESVAELMIEAKYPFIFRDHDKPKEEKFKQFLSIAGVFGYKFKGDSEKLTPKAVQTFIKQFDDKHEGEVLRVLMLRAMSKAEYSATNIGHFGLASKAYSHFTSPIRRYPDLIGHRMLRKFLINKDHTGKDIASAKDFLPYAADHSSQREVGAVTCEREVTKMKMCEYMEQHIGDTFEGKISGVAGFGMFVQLENMIEGMIHVSTMIDDEYIFDENHLKFTGMRTKKKFTIGDEVKIKVIGASKIEQTIDFELFKEEEKES